MKKVLAALSVSAFAALSAPPAGAQQLGAPEWAGISASVAVAVISILGSEDDSVSTTTTTTTTTTSP